MARKKPEFAEIYEIIDPRDGSVRYIGKAHNTASRFKQHLREVRRRNTPLYAWIGKMLGMGLPPTARVSIMCRAEHWQEVEIAAIAAGRAEGMALLNVAEGGDKPACSQEVRKAMGARLNAPVSPKVARLRYLKRMLGQAMRRGEVGEATKAKMRAAAVRHPALLGDWAGV